MLWEGYGGLLRAAREAGNTKFVRHFWAARHAHRVYEVWADGQTGEWHGEPKPSPGDMYTFTEWCNMVNTYDVCYTTFEPSVPSKGWEGFNLDYILYEERLLRVRWKQ